MNHHGRGLVHSPVLSTPIKASLTHVVTGIFSPGICPFNFATIISTHINGHPLVFRVAPHHDVNCCSTTLQINFPPTTSPHSLSMHFHVPHLYRSHPFQSPDTVSIQSGRGWERRGSGFLGHGRARTIFKHASLVLFWCSCLYIGV